METEYAVELKNPSCVTSVPCDFPVGQQEWPSHTGHRVWGRVLLHGAVLVPPFVLAPYTQDKALCSCGSAARALQRLS